MNFKQLQMPSDGVKHQPHSDIQQSAAGVRKYSRSEFLATLAPFTQRSHINAAAAVHQFSAFGNSHRAKHHRLKDKLCVIYTES